MVVNALGGGIHFYGFSIFFLPLREDLAISAASASLIFALARAEGAIEGPLAGYLIDRLGSRVMMFIGVTLAGAGYLLLSVTNSFVTFVLVYVLVISVAFNAGFGAATLALVNNWFIRRRGLVTAIATSAFALGGAAVAPLLGIIVDAWGWRTGAALSGAALLLVALPSITLVRRSPESIGLLPDGDVRPEEPHAGGPDVAAANEADVSLSQALRTSTFWLFVAGTTFRIAANGAFVLHFVAIMVWKGTGETTAAALLGLMALLSIPLRIGLGILGDRLAKDRLLAVIHVIGAASMLLLLWGGDSWYLWAFVPVFALVESSPALNWALVGDYFGRRHYGTIRGFMTIFFGGGQMIVPFLAGLSWDRSSTYAPSLIGFALLWLLSAAVFAIIRAPKSEATGALAPAGASVPAADG